MKVWLESKLLYTASGRGEKAMTFDLDDKILAAVGERRRISPRHQQLAAHAHTIIVVHKESPNFVDIR